MKIDKDIADAIELFLDDSVRVMKRSLKESKAILVAEDCGQNWEEYEYGQYKSLNNISTYDLMVCLVNGYEVIDV